MKILPLEISGLILIEPKVYSDSRGYFFESFREDLVRSQIGPIQFIQDNEARSSYGVFRGFHFQTGARAQSKLIRVVLGKVLDIVVDLRPNSESFKKTFAIEISAENKRQIFVPKGFAHGYLTLSDQAVVLYKVDEYYSKESESGIRYNDPALKIQWPIEKSKLLLSEKDEKLPLLNELKDFHWQ